MTPEHYFFRYSYPCTEGRALRDLIPSHLRDQLNEHARSDTAPPRSMLVSAYTDAIDKIRRWMHVEGDAVWDMGVVRTYFRSIHNQTLDAGDIDPVFKEALARSGTLETFIGLCKVYETRVEDIQGDDILVSNPMGFGPPRIPVRNAYDLPVDAGSTITIHLGYAIELLTPN